MNRHYGALLNGREYKDGDELGRVCSGLEKREQSGLGWERSPGLVFTVSDLARGTWPKVSKTARWAVLGASSFEDRNHDWGRSEEERRELVWGTVTFRRDKSTGAIVTPQHERKSDGTYYDWWIRLMGPVRAKWLLENPGWWEEKRREAEIDASPQVAGEMTDMGLDNRSIVAGHLAKSIEGGEVVEISAVFPSTNDVKY